MKRLWTWIKEHKNWDWLLGIFMLLVVVVIILEIINPCTLPIKSSPTSTTTAYTTRADCTHAMELHAAEVDRLHDRNERNLTELIIAREQLKLREQLDMDGFVGDSPLIPSEGD